MRCPNCSQEVEIIEKELVGVGVAGETQKECANCGQPIDDKKFRVKLEKEVKAEDRNEAIEKFVNRITYEGDEVEVEEVRE